METKDCQNGLCLTVLLRSCAPWCHHSFQQNHMGLLSIFRKRLKKLNQQRGFPGWCNFRKYSVFPKLPTPGWDGRQIKSRITKKSKPKIVGLLWIFEKSCSCSHEDLAATPHCQLKLRTFAMCFNGFSVLVPCKGWGFLPGAHFGCHSCPR